MSLFEDLSLSLVKKYMNITMELGEMKEISSAGIIEHRDIPYENRSGSQLAMDIYEPAVTEKIDLPVIIYIHGGGLIVGDKNLSEGFCRQLARRGYLVCSLEYRLVPEVRVYEQLDDVCAGMDFAGRKLVEFDVDFTRIYAAAESAGAFLAVYTAAMKKSGPLQEAIGYQPSCMRFNAMALISGMFYTARKDKTGIFLSRSFYGNDEHSKKMSKFTNPEHPEIINNIPPCYLVTSKADMLENYTLDFAGELERKGIEHKLRQMGDDRKLIHAFPVLRPDLPESEFVIDEIVQWFRSHERKTGDSAARILFPGKK